MHSPDDLQTLAKRLGHEFESLDLLVRALTHTSYANEHPRQGGSYERLEFLGDAVLDLAVGHMLMRRFPEGEEGTLSKLRASAVNEARLASQARRLELGVHLLLGKGEERTGGREKDSVLADVYEACIGAIFKDAGYEAARAAVEAHFADVIDSLSPDVNKDYKTRLQELTQAKMRTTPIYVLSRESGPDHDKTFEVQLTVDGNVLGVGEGKSKKEAEQNAARQALEAISAEGDAA